VPAVPRSAGLRVPRPEQQVGQACDLSAEGFVSESEQKGDRIECHGPGLDGVLRSAIKEVKALVSAGLIAQTKRPAPACNVYTLLDPESSPNVSAV
jgi:hypothetical protein